MSANHESLQKLIKAARKAHAPPAQSDMPAPFGFSTRVAARWVTARGLSNWTEPWERLCWWGAGASVAVCLVAAGYQSLAPEPNPLDVLMEAQAGGPDML